MAQSRRKFLTRGLAGAAGVLMIGGRSGSVLASLRTDPSPDFFDWKPAGKDHVALGEGGNSLLIIGRGGSVLVDCKNAPFGAALRREAARRDATLELVINTHHHADHTGGNHAFSADLPILAHENCKPRIEPQMNRYISQAKEAVASLTASEKPAAEQVRKDAMAYHGRMAKLVAKEFEPTRSMADLQELKIGGVTITLFHFGPGHTDNDVVVFLPDRNLVHCGDLLFHKRHPFIDLGAGATTEGWTASVRKIIDLCDDKTVVVPGHGEITDVAGLRSQVEYFEQAREVVAAAIKEGKTRQETQALMLPRFKEYGPAGRTLGTIYEELKGQP